jgi:protein subunit release factor A
MPKELLFSESKKKGDFEVQPFKGSGNGGQKRNKTMSACRVKHIKSGAVAECQEERSFEQNKKRAFTRCVNSETYRQWHKLECAKRMGVIADIEQEVNKEMQNIKVEVFQNGKWTEV